jgi:hypothetical protein
VLYFHGYFTVWRPEAEGQIVPGGNFGGNSYKNCVQNQRLEQLKKRDLRKLGLTGMLLLLGGFAPAAAQAGVARTQALASSQIPAERMQQLVRSGSGLDAAVSAH